MAGVVVTAGAPADAGVACRCRTAGGRRPGVSGTSTTRQLAGWCAALVGDRDAAHDIASEAFTRLLSKWVTVHDPKGYLYVTATNLVRDRWRREQRDRACRPGSRRAPVVHPGLDPWLRDLVERLPDRLRTPVLLHYYADMSVAEVAAALHQPEERSSECCPTPEPGCRWLEEDR